MLNNDDCSYIKQFLTALRKNATLKELSVHGSIVASSENAAMFADFLKNTATLTTLTFRTEHLLQGTLRFLHEGLLENSTVSKLHLFIQPYIGMGFHIRTHISQQVAALAFRNVTLRSVHVSYLKACFDWYTYPVLRFDEDWDCWMEALELNDNVEEVTLPLFHWKDEWWESFFGSLPSKNKPRKLTLERRNISTCCLQPICDALMRSGAEGKVNFDSCRADDAVDVLMCKAI